MFVEIWDYFLISDMALGLYNRLLSTFLIPEKEVLSLLFPTKSLFLIWFLTKTYMKDTF